MPVLHIALGKYENATKTMNHSHNSAMCRIIRTKSITKVESIRFCVFVVDTAFLRFQKSQFIKCVLEFSVFRLEQCEPAKTDYFLSVFVWIRSNVNGAWERSKIFYINFFVLEQCKTFQVGRNRPKLCWFVLKSLGLSRG